MKTPLLTLYIQIIPELKYSFMNYTLKLILVLQQRIILRFTN